MRVHLQERIMFLVLAVVPPNKFYHIVTIFSGLTCVGLSG